MIVADLDDDATVSFGKGCSSTMIESSEGHVSLDLSRSKTNTCLDQRLDFPMTKKLNWIEAIDAADSANDVSAKDPFFFVQAVTPNAEHNSTKLP